jgi:rhodanese-like protein
MRIPKILLASLVAAVLWPQLSPGAEVRGIVESIASSVRAIQVLDPVTGQSTVVTVTADTVLVNAASLRDFAVNDIVVVEMEPNGRATRLTRAVVPIGPERILGVEDVAALLKGSVPYTLVDARPKAAFDEGHIPTAIPVYVDDLQKQWDKLPADKDRLLVFYCTGST